MKTVLILNKGGLKNLTILSILRLTFTVEYLRVLQLKAFLLQQSLHVLFCSCEMTPALTCLKFIFQYLRLIS